MITHVTTKTIVLIIASNGFQPLEYTAVRDVVKSAGIKIITVSDAVGTAVASDGTTVVGVDATIDQLGEQKGVPFNSIDGIFLIGGPGALDCLDTEVTKTMLKRFAETKKPYGAICISPRILAEAGLLKGKKATGWNGDKKVADIFKKYKVEADLISPVVIDGQIITADGPHAAKEFGQAIVQVIKNN